ncbi:nitroreductase family protein [Sphingomonas hengshuiensis]|uniref:nitroreductase family protein n=1 Tax=Sphingomonas hengshuiensis TaxID=1609977 RepID=UPI0005CAE6FA|nr:nitroreductase [Sphingomonas hengshuiensis]
MLFNDRTTPLSLLQTRRSGKPREMIAPGPGADQIDAILAIAARTPDHGKLNPWRFVVIEDDQRPAFALRLVEILRAEKPDATPRDEEAAAQFATQAPALIVVLSAPVVGHKVPLWEQELSAGAVCMNLLHATHAMGFVGSWITGWAAYSDGVRDLFGAAPQRIAGFLFLGSPGRPLEERPRGALSEIVHRWKSGDGPKSDLVY